MPYEVCGAGSVSSATTALQDPHHIEARPSLIARVRGADLLVCPVLNGPPPPLGWLTDPVNGVRFRPTASSPRLIHASRLYWRSSNCQNSYQFA